MELSEQLSFAIRSDSIQGVMIECLMNGLYTAIVVFTVHRLVSERGWKAIYSPTILLVLFMYCCSLVHLAIVWSYTKLAFVDYGQSPQSTTIHLNIWSVPLVWVITSTLARGAIMFIADCIMIWRCWVIYVRSWKVIVLPIILLLGELAFFICYFINQTRGFSFTSLLSSTQFIIIHLAFTLATTLLITLLILYRIVRMGGARRFSNTIGIVVESAALYAITIIVYMPFPMHPTLTDIIPNAVLVPMPGIASTLIITRAALSREVASRRPLMMMDMESFGIPTFDSIASVSVKESEEDIIGLPEYDSQLSRDASTRTIGRSTWSDQRFTSTEGTK